MSFSIQSCHCDVCYYNYPQDHYTLQVIGTEVFLLPKSRFSLIPYDSWWYSDGSAQRCLMAQICADL